MKKCRIGLFAAGLLALTIPVWATTPIMPIQESAIECQSMDITMKPTYSVSIYKQSQMLVNFYRVEIEETKSLDGSEVAHYSKRATGTIEDNSFELSFLDKTGELGQRVTDDSQSFDGSLTFRG